MKNLIVHIHFKNVRPKYYTAAVDFQLKLPGAAVLKHKVLRKLQVMLSLEISVP
jgi:hypothetical protein